MLFCDVHCISSLYVSEKRPNIYMHPLWLIVRSTNVSGRAGQTPYKNFSLYFEKQNWPQIITMPGFHDAFSSPEKQMRSNSYCLQWMLLRWRHNTNVLSSQNGCGCDGPFSMGCSTPFHHRCGVAEQQTIIMKTAMMTHEPWRPQTRQITKRKTATLWKKVHERIGHVRCSDVDIRFNFW